ncbi:DUF309 domain-containing protein [Halalkalibacterium ligniniphilum]|uniref:DUF309 domain-containing protein n=1 Tax=Halalkalibacterium ligniniphilum TaxID=1134413 RepID=UPI00034D0C2A|nr:DUF309 domain-containing protein [Halalkalibacterium ligniniphilum]
MSALNVPCEFMTFVITFNEGDYYTCHDLLEEIWLTDRQNLFVKGLLQLSVSLYHYGYGNVKGSRSMMKVSYHYLDGYRPQHWGLDVEHILAFIVRCLSIIPQDIDSVPFENVKELPELPRLILTVRQ